MSTLISGTSVRLIGLGFGPESKSTGTITGNPTTTLFNVAGGEVLITGLWATATTALTADGGTYAIQSNPSGTGDTRVIVTATDLGTSDTAVGSVIGLTGRSTTAPSFLRGGTAELGAIVSTGTIEFVGASSANGALTVSVTWVPLTTGATLVAA